jgi:hypothetical protein
VTAPNPLDYAAWRATRLGRITEALERLAAQAGLVAGHVRGTVFHPPIGFAAVALAPLDPLLGRVSTLGAAFLAMEARKPGRGEG